MAERALEAGRFVVAAPRWHAKSTILLLALPLYMTMHRKSASDIFILKASDPEADEWIQKIALEIETNPVLRDRYKVRKGTRWHTTQPAEIQFWVGYEDEDNPGTLCTIRGRGWGPGFRGKHPDVVIFDDPQDLLDVDSDDRRDDIEKWTIGTLLGATGDEELDFIGINTKVILSGTLLDPRSLISIYAGNGVDRPPAPGWDSMVVSCVRGNPEVATAEEAKALLSNPETQVVWPEARPREFLLAKLTKDFRGREHLFILDFFSRDAVRGEFFLAESKVNECKLWRRPDEIRAQKQWVYVAVDPATGKKDVNDPTALIAMAFYLDGADEGKQQILEWDTAKVRGYERVTFIVNFILKHRANAVVVETNKDSDLPLLIEQKIRERKFRALVDSVEQKPQESKKKRIENECTHCLAGEVLFPSTMPPEMRAKIFRYPGGVTQDNEIDVMAIGIRWGRENKRLARAGRAVVNDPEKESRNVFREDQGIFRLDKDGRLVDTMRDIAAEKKRLESGGDDMTGAWDRWDR